MMALLRGVFQILCISVVAIAIPLSLIEDAKEMHLNSPIRSNKVKRAQEVIMFGNQQNRGSEVRGYTFPRTEKRAASDVDDNTLSDVATLPNILPQVEENNFDTNQLDSGNRVADLDTAYQYGGDPIFNAQFHNAALREIYNDPAYNELSLYNLVDARRKREAKLLKSYKLGLRNKRELDFNPDDILPLVKLLEAERRNKMHETRIGWPNYENDEYDSVDDLPEDNEVDQDSEYLQNGGHWLSGPIIPHRNGADFLYPRQQKQIMVTKRRLGDETLAKLVSGKQDKAAHIPLYRRFVL